MPHKRCAWGLCRSDSQYNHKDYMKDVTFLPFPKPKTQLERCKEWIRQCNRPHSQLNMEQIGKHHYVCSKHFKEGCVDPEPLAVQMRQVRKRKPALDRHMHTLKVARKQMQDDNPLNTKPALALGQAHTSQNQKEANEPHTSQTEEDSSYLVQSSSLLTTKASPTSQSAQASPLLSTKRSETTCTTPRKNEFLPDFKFILSSPPKITSYAKCNMKCSNCGNTTELPDKQPCDLMRSRFIARVFKSDVIVFISLVFLPCLCAMLCLTGLFHQFLKKKQKPMFLT